MALAELYFASGETSLSVRRFVVHEEASTLFTISVWACSESASVNLARLVGQPVGLALDTGFSFSESSQRRWSGVCRAIEQLRPEADGLSSYRVDIVPDIWKLTQRQNYRVFQHVSLPELVAKLLAEWEVSHQLKLQADLYPKLNYKVQYAESDYDFVSRLLEEAGIAYVFAATSQGSVLTLDDALEKTPLRAGPPLPFFDNPSRPFTSEFVTQVRLSHEVRPGAHLLHDYDLRRPLLDVAGKASSASQLEERLEQYHYRPGGALIEAAASGDTPVADDAGAARHELAYAGAKAERTLAAMREGREQLSFMTNAIDLRPGSVFRMAHPHSELAANKLLVTAFSIEGSVTSEWRMSGRAVLAERPYRPALITQRPRVHGVQSAVVVGPAEEEIHTDEFGRVRIQFPWDREGNNDDKSSCWVRVNQGWAGAGYGMQKLPRVGQEVLVSFLDGNPDQPFVVGRLYNKVQPVPYKLPDNKTISGYKSNASPGSQGFNELRLEDKAGEELYYLQAEKNLRKLVKHDETITVGHDRDKTVVANETDTTGVNRVEITAINRSQTIGASRSVVIGGHRTERIKGDDYQRVEGSKLLLGAQDQHIEVAGKKRAKNDWDVHLLVEGDRRQKIGGKQSLIIIEDQFEKVAGRHALQTGNKVYMQANEAITGEAQDITLKGPGGFIRIDANGVTIKGTVVRINTGPEPGRG